MEAEDPLSQLADIHLPGDVSIWPLAPGWWLLLLVIVMLLLWLIRHIVVTLVKKRKLTAVMNELDACYQKYQEQAGFENLQNQAGLELLQEINALLKRVAIVHYPDKGVEYLNGPDWLEFLDKHTETEGFMQGPGMILSDGVYRAQFNGDADALYNLVREWIHWQYLGKGKSQPEQGSVAA